MSTYEQAWLLTTNINRQRFVNKLKRSIQAHLEATYVHLALEISRGTITGQEARDTFVRYLENDLHARRDPDLCTDILETWNAPQGVLKNDLRLCLERLPGGDYKLEFPATLTPA